MKLFLFIVVWLVLFLFLPVVAMTALVLLPIIWLLSLPIRLISIIVNAVFELLKAILLLPARLLTTRPVT
ncbi:MAG: hypothetical protein CMJ19_06710 [Phycisphaeraceae bacterium]|nr:hypothetical protein [Phycisphaeraceae bacterium]|tara:strand:- start:58 stop:267 length:210 start_codon:yes stop_codon:yes gene_type:complete